MGVQFDPYAEWLQVPADRRPPTHYDLLMWEPTIEVDGRVVQRNTEVLA